MILETLPIARLTPAPYNPRSVTPEVLEALKNSIVDFGLVQPVIVNKRNGLRIVGGHQRVTALEALGETSVECVVVDLDDRAEAALNLALNAISGEFETTALRDVLEFLDVGDGYLEKTGFSEDEIARLLTEIGEATETVVVPPVPETSSEAQTVTAVVKCPFDAWPSLSGRLKALVEASGGTVETL